jgi:hypothetical protein
VPGVEQLERRAHESRDGSNRERRNKLNPKGNKHNIWPAAGDCATGSMTASRGVMLLPDGADEDENEDEDEANDDQTVILERRRALAQKMADDSVVRSAAFKADFNETCGRLATPHDAKRRTVHAEDAAAGVERQVRTPATESRSLLSSRLSTRTPVCELVASQLPMRLPTPKAHLPHHLFPSPSSCRSVATSTSAPFLLPMPTKPTATRTSAADSLALSSNSVTSHTDRRSSTQQRRAALKEAARLSNETILVPPPFAPLLSAPATSIAAAVTSPQGARPSARLSQPPTVKCFLAPNRIQSRVPAYSILNRAPSVATSRAALPAVSDQWIHPTPSPGLLTRLAIPSNAQVDGAWRRVECQAERLMRQQRLQAAKLSQAEAPASCHRATNRLVYKRRETSRGPGR